MIPSNKTTYGREYMYMYLHVYLLLCIIRCTCIYYLFVVFRLCLSLIKDESPSLLLERNLILSLELLEEFNIVMLPIKGDIWDYSIAGRFGGS